MGRTDNGTIINARVTTNPLLRKFARRLWDRYRARVYLFGSRARGTEHAQSDYDLIAVSPAFASVSRFRRCLDRDDLWLEAGGWRRPLDLHCYAPEEFRREKTGLGYVGEAHRNGELWRISVAPCGGITALEPASAHTERFPVSTQQDCERPPDPPTSGLD